MELEVGQEWRVVKGPNTGRAGYVTKVYPNTGKRGNYIPRATLLELSSGEEFTVWETSLASMVEEEPVECVSMETLPKNTPSSFNQEMLEHADGWECRAVLKEAFKVLDERQRRTLILRFGLNDGHIRTLHETGEEMGGWSRERARQIEGQALHRLRGIDVRAKLLPYHS